MCAYALIAAGIVLLLRGFLRVGSNVRLAAMARRGASSCLRSWRFGLIAPRFGYAVAGLLTIVISGFAARDAKPVSLLAFALGMVTFSVVLFSFVLKVPMPAFTLRGLGV